jgi:hypothetical protein
MAVRLGSEELELRAFSAPLQLLERMAASCGAREVQVSSGKIHFVGGFWLARGVSVTVIDPYVPAFHAYGPGAAAFLKARPEDSVWPNLPKTWASAIGRLLGDGSANVAVDPPLEGAIRHVLH